MDEIKIQMFGGQTYYYNSTEQTMKLWPIFVKTNSENFWTENKENIQKIIFIFPQFQDEKNQILTTNVWLNLVSSY